MRTITLDGSAWRTGGDFYDAILLALGAPAWHGRNLDALNDTIRGDDINELKLPYEIVIQGYALMGSEATGVVDRFREVVTDLESGGLPVRISVR
jgi:RNAse (barnase) inhibitor barstar